MSNFKYPKGSEWRKWDLQIHVPGAKHADQYKAENCDDIWEKFIEYIKNSDVSVFGITDYFSIDGYVTFREKTKNVIELKDKKFFPCVELRLDISVNRDLEQLQCHLIFDNDYEIDKINNFLSHLQLTNKKTNNAAAYCIDKDITECGGYDGVSVTKEKLEESLINSFGNDRPFLIAGIASGMGSNRANANSNIKKELADLFDNFCDLFFGHDDNRNYYLNENRHENKDFMAKAKPVVATSDCHCFDDCEKKLGKKFLIRNQEGKDLERYGFTWIKADTTFEGLRQIIYEPVDRVAFSYEKPESKKSYYLIDKVRFIDSTGQDNFSSDTIDINQNLVTIIGGKSTGKSLLLYYIAKTIDKKEVENRFEEYSAANQYNCDESPNFNFEVVWADGDSTFLKNIEDYNTIDERKILYIPQNYLNKLSEINARSRDTLNKFVKDIFLQNEDIRENYESNLTRIKGLSKSIPNTVANLYQIKQEIEEIEESIKQLGDEKGIKKYIAKLQREADSIKRKSGLSNKEIKDYEALLEKEKEANKVIAVLSNEKKSLVSFKEELLQKLESLEELRDEQLSYLENDEIKKEFLKEFDKIGQMKTNLLKAANNIISFVNAKIKDYQKELEKIKKDLMPFMAKIKLQDEMKKKNEALMDEQKKLDKITLEKKSLEKKKNNYNKEKMSLIEIYKEIFKGYDDVKNGFKKYENFFEDINLNVSVGFNEKRFNDEVINGFLNKQDLKRNNKSISWEDEYEYQFDPYLHLTFITDVLNSIIDGKIKTIKGRSTKDALVNLLDDYFDLDFIITYKNDSLDKMSPGKKSLVLLRFLIDFSNEEWPILLDQPEDDLDNRSVYEDLVSFVKNKKKNRQIIIVTHNPNLVVGADAEQIIVANQEGQERGRDNKKFKFEYVSGSLENTFEMPESQQKAILFRKGIRQHVCEILEGGQIAFEKREKKYGFKTS
jgi:ABC-type Mn2+/Zn2+ transport system ATPase subunit